MLKKEALAANQNWTRAIVSIVDYDTGDKLGPGIKKCNTASSPNLELFKLLRENFNWTGIDVKGPKKCGYQNGANGERNFVEYR